MNDFYDKVNQLINNISTGRMDVEEVKLQIEDLKRDYGANAFPSFDFVEKPKPWNMAYLHELQKKNVTGAGSEEFIVHMAEVSNYVYKKKKRVVFGLIVGGVIVIVLLVGMLLFNNNERDDNQSVGDINESVEEVYIATT